MHVYECFLLWTALHLECVNVNIQVVLHCHSFTRNYQFGNQ
jgi:hypothetical protein